MVESRRGPVKDHLVLFPGPEDVARLASQCRPHELYRVRHALTASAPPGASLVGPSNTTCLDLTSPADVVYHGMDAKSCRYEIRRAEKLGDRLGTRRRGLRAQYDFFRLYNDFVTWKGYAKPMTPRRLREYLEVSDVLVAYVDDVPLAAHLLGVDRSGDGRVRLIFSASARFIDGEMGKLASPVNRWLHWQEMQYYQSEGIATYDFGGGTSSSSIGRFKLSFGGSPEIGYDMLIVGALVRLPLRLREVTSRARRARHAPVDAPPVAT